MEYNLVTYEDFELNNFAKLRNLELIDDIVEKRLTILKVIEGIGTVFTSDSKEIRGRGIEFLTWILNRIPPDLLSETELVPLASFFGDRLNDHHSLIPKTLHGIYAMACQSHIGHSICELMHKLFQFVVCQSQVVIDRLNIYCIIEECAKRHLNQIQNIGPDFLFGVIAAIEGETDPKNLRFIFTFMPKLLTQLKNTEHLTGDIFEVFSTYFPVDFTSVTKDGICITREDLANGLSLCLTSTSSLSAECLPLIVEKLDSSLTAAKIDSYTLLQRCCSNLSVSKLEQFLGSLWKLIRLDLIPPGSPSVQTQALKSLSKIVGVLSRDEADLLPLNRFLDDVIISIRSLLPKPSDNLFVPSMRILEALCPESKHATARAFLELESLCKLDGLNSSEQQTLLTALFPFLSCSGAAPKSMDVIAAYCMAACGNSSERIRTIAFKNLLEIMGYLLADERKSQIFETMLTSAKLETSAEYYTLLRRIAERSPESFFQGFYLPFNSFYESDDISAAQFFEAVGFLADLPLVTEAAIPCILNCISSGKDTEFALKALLSTCKIARRAGFFTEVTHKHDLLRKLTVWSFEVEDLNVIITVAEILVIMVSHLDKDTQVKLDDAALSIDRYFFDSISKNPRKVILLEGMFGGFRQGVSIPHVECVIRVSKDIALGSDCCVARKAAGRLLAALVNKMPHSVGQWLLDEANDAINEGKHNVDHAIAMLAWILKGALLGSLSELDAWIFHWFGMLRNSRLSRSVAIWTRNILEKESVFLTEETHCTIKFLYRQRLFTFVPKILEFSETCAESLKENHLLTMITLALNVPKSVLKSEKSVNIFVSRAMLSSDIAVVGPAFHLLKNLLADKSPTFTDNITTLLPAMLRFVTFPDLHTRILAINCVFLAGFYETRLILPYKKKVVKSLVPCLDDKKRIVRSEAVRARSRWCLVGAVGEDALTQ